MEKKESLEFPPRNKKGRGGEISFLAFLPLSFPPRISISRKRNSGRQTLRVEKSERKKLCMHRGRNGLGRREKGWRRERRSWLGSFRANLIRSQARRKSRSDCSRVSGAHSRKEDRGGRRRHIYCLCPPTEQRGSRFCRAVYMGKDVMPRFHPVGKDPCSASSTIQGVAAFRTFYK